MGRDGRRNAEIPVKWPRSSPNNPAESAHGGRQRRQAKGIAHMTFIVPPVDGSAPAHGARPLRFRRRRLPPEVVEQLYRAAELCEDLAESGVQLRFDAPGDGTRVRA